MHEGLWRTLETIWKRCKAKSRPSACATLTSLRFVTAWSQDHERRFAADAPAREFEFHGFDARLDGGMLILSPRGHFADKDRARKAVEPHLRAWETSEMLTTGRLEFSFRFDGLSAIDRDPQPGGPRAMSVAVSSVVHIEDATSTHVTPSSYVSPPAQPVSLKPELSDVVSRWRLLMDGREDLLGVAYFVLSFLRNHYGGGRGRSATTTPGFIELGNRE